MERDEVRSTNWHEQRAHPLAPPVTVAGEDYDADLDVFEFMNGRAVVHKGSACLQPTCVIHNPSDHHMRALPMLLRETTLIERICPHGVGHPDPDSIAYFDNVGREGFGVHGCDGCCGRVWLDTVNVECPECGSPMHESDIVKRWVCSNFGGCELSVG